jgi:hypothetical protein
VLPWRIREIRGWSLKFKRLSETRFPGIITLKYQALAQNNGMCVECHITDTNALAAEQRAGQANPGD